MKSVLIRLADFPCHIYPLFSLHTGTHFILICFATVQFWIFWIFLKQISYAEVSWLAGGLHLYTVGLLEVVHGSGDGDPVPSLGYVFLACPCPWLTDPDDILVPSLIP